MNISLKTWWPAPFVTYPWKHVVTVLEKKVFGSHQTSSDIYFSKMSNVQNHSMKSWLVQLPWSFSMAYEIIPMKLRSILHYIKLVYYNMDYFSRDYHRFQAQLNTPGYNPWIRYIEQITSGPNWSLFQNLSVCFLFSGRLQTQPRRHSARHSQCARAKTAQQKEGGGAKLGFLERGRRSTKLGEGGRLKGQSTEPWPRKLCFWCEDKRSYCHHASFIEPILDTDISKDQQKSQARKGTKRNSHPETWNSRPHLFINDNGSIGSWFQPHLCLRKWLGNHQTAIHLLQKLISFFSGLPPHPFNLISPLKRGSGLSIHQWNSSCQKWHQNT